MSGALILGAISPIFYILYLVYKKDTEKEPMSVLAACFGMGMLIIIPILIMEMVLEETISAVFSMGTVYNFLHAFVVAAFSEELFKFMALVYILRKTKYFDQHYDGIVYAVFVSMGFALVENIGYVFQGGLGVAALRAVLSVPAHAFFGVFMGYFISLAYLGNLKLRKINLYLSLIVPVILHGIFDFAIFENSFQFENENFGTGGLYILIFVLLNIGFWRYGLRRIKEHVRLDEKAIAAHRKNDENDPFA